MKEHNQLSAYCFLAALTENNNDLYNHVYVPICKRALSEYTKRGKEFGTHLDIKEIILELYGIDVPESIVCKLIRGAEASMSRRQKGTLNFKLLDNGRSFQLGNWDFTELDEKFEKSKRDATAIQNAFLEFVTVKNVFNEEIPSFNDFLNRYKIRLSSFFAGEVKQIEQSEDTIFFYHIEFLEYVQRGNHQFYTIAQELYLGAIVASFLETGFDTEIKSSSGEVFYLDTPVVLRALDLQKAEETNPIKELISLIRKTNGTPKILSITIEEIQRVIKNAIDQYNQTNPITTIGDAIKRKGRDKAWLLSYNLNLPKKIWDELKIEIEQVKDEFLKENEKTPDIPALQEIRSCKRNAAHDVFAYLFVRNQRGTSLSNHQNAKIWFVTTNSSLLEFNIAKRLSHAVPEIILPDMLTSLLWLKDPVKLINEVKSIGLRELMTCTLIEEVASKELINEYSNQLKKIDGLDGDSYKTLLEAVAHYSASSIEKFIGLVESDNTRAKEEALKIVEEERRRKAELQQRIVETQDAEESEKRINKELADKITEIENKLVESNEKANSEINNLKGEIERQGGKIDAQSEQIENIKRRFKKDLFWLILGVFCLLFFVLTFVYLDRLGCWSWLTGVLTGSGWLWGFGSFGVNVFRIINRK